MLSRKTELLPSETAPIDTVPLSEAASLLVAAQVEAARAVLACADEISAASGLMAGAISGGARLYYVAAGSSGLMAAADAMELKGTFSIPPAQVRILMAGGIPQTADMPGDVEDATQSLADDLAEIGEADCLIVVSASGSTPYALEAARIGRRANAAVIAIVNNANTPLSELSDRTIFLDTPPEQVSGSTRLGAGTAQKIALNTLSTLMGVELGHVYKGMMVNLLADNAKLRARAIGIVQQVAAVDEGTARDALLQAGGDVKAASLLARGAPTPKDANDALAHSGGRLGRAIDYLGLK